MSIKGNIDILLPTKHFSFRFFEILLLSRDSNVQKTVHKPEIVQQNAVQTAECEKKPTAKLEIIINGFFIFFTPNYNDYFKKVNFMPACLSQT